MSVSVHRGSEKTQIQRGSGLCQTIRACTNTWMLPAFDGYSLEKVKAQSNRTSPRLISIILEAGRLASKLRVIGYVCQ